MTDHTRLDYHRTAHHQRYVRYVNAMPRKLMCQECGGGGENLEEMHDLGGGCLYPRYDPCGWCEGTGLVTPHLRGVWLRWRRTCRGGEA